MLGKSVKLVDAKSYTLPPEDVTTCIEADDGIDGKAMENSVTERDLGA
jgi:hypothetical protein